MGIESAIGFALIGYGLLGAGIGGGIALSESQRKARQRVGAADIARGEGLKKITSAVPIGAEATPEQKARVRRRTKTILSAPITGEEEFGIAPPVLLGSGDVTKKSTVG